MDNKIRNYMTSTPFAMTKYNLSFYAFTVLTRPAGNRLYIHNNYMGMNYHGLVCPLQTDIAAGNSDSTHYFGPQTTKQPPGGGLHPHEKGQSFLRGRQPSGSAKILKYSNWLEKRKEKKGEDTKKLCCFSAVLHLSSRWNEF